MMADTSVPNSTRSSNASRRSFFLVLLLGLFSILFSSKTLRRQTSVVKQESTTDGSVTGRRTKVKQISSAMEVAALSTVTSKAPTVSNTSSSSAPTANATNTTSDTSSISLIKSSETDAPTTKPPVDRLSVFSVCGVPNALLTDKECQKQLHSYSTVATMSTQSQKRYETNLSSLVWDLDCFRLQHAMEQTGVTRTVNFIATANKKYEDFLPSYAFSALSHNNNSVVEFIVEDHTKFIQKHAPALAWLLDNMGDAAAAAAATTTTTEQHDGDDNNNSFVSNNHRICVRSFQTDSTRLQQAVKNTWRFLETPILRNHTEYTYIGDVDVYMYESVLDPNRLEQMSKFHIPYSNIVRLNDFWHGEGRLTGLMLIKTKEFYTPALIQAQQTVNVTGNDERVLYRMVKAAGLGLPPITPGLDEYLLVNNNNNTASATEEEEELVDLVTYRPVHGLHLSLNRGPYMRMCQPSWTEYRVRWTWCAVMKTPRLAEFWCHDRAGRALMQQFVQRVQEQIKGKFQKIDGNCTPTLLAR